MSVGECFDKKELEDGYGGSHAPLYQKKKKLGWSSSITAAAATTWVINILTLFDFGNYLIIINTSTP